jgi:hypothetical protein
MGDSMSNSFFIAMMEEIKRENITGSMLRVYNDGDHVGPSGLKDSEIKAFSTAVWYPPMPSNPNPNPVYLYALTAYHVMGSIQLLGKLISCTLRYDMGTHSQE